MAKGNGTKLIAQNKKAYHDYFIEEVFQAGISLVGTEVKSLRAGKCSLKESFIRIENEEALIYNMHISPYEQGNIFNKDPLRVRRLLLHKNQIRKISQESKVAGYTIVPLKVYLDRSLVKIDIALAKGKKLYDKRDTISKNDQKRQAEKEFKIRNLTL
ncbi:SsrA-binding protein [anaerobic digester metagenome]